MERSCDYCQNIVYQLSGSNNIIKSDNLQCIIFQLSHSKAAKFTDIVVWQPLPHTQPNVGKLNVFQQLLQCTISCLVQFSIFSSYFLYLLYGTDATNLLSLQVCQAKYNFSINVC